MRWPRADHDRLGWYVGLYRCGPCKRQFTVKVGTVFESSHLPLNLWLQAAYLMCGLKNGISSHQLIRTLDVQYKTAWFMTHRLREAMRAGTLPPMGGKGIVVEIDETFIGKKEGAEVRRGYAHKHAVLALVPRGGTARSFHVRGTKVSGLKPIIKANVLSGTYVMTDEAAQYAHLNTHFAAHGYVGTTLTNMGAAISTPTRSRGSIPSSSAG